MRTIFLSCSFALLSLSAHAVMSAGESLRILPMERAFTVLEHLTQTADKLKANQVQWSLFGTLVKAAQDPKLGYGKDPSGALLVYPSKPLVEDWAKQDPATRDKGPLLQTKVLLRYDFGILGLHWVTAQSVTLEARIITKPACGPIETCQEFIQVYLDKVIAESVPIPPVGAISSAGGGK